MKKSLVLTIIALSAMICAGAYADITSGLVGYWSFDAGTAKDDSGNGNNGVLVGNPQSVAGKAGNGKAFDFNGDDGIEIADDPLLQLPDAFTLSCWMYPRGTKDANGNDHAGVVWKGSKIGWGADVYNYRIAVVDDAGVTFGACGGGVESHFRDAVLTEFNVWYHLAYTADGSIGIAYINGVTNATLSRADAITYEVLAGEPIRIGWSQGRGGDINTLVYFDGMIDEVTLHDRALSADEVNELMTTRPTAVEFTGKIASVWGKIKKE